MRLYEIQVPATLKPGQAARLRLWERKILDLAGGYSARPVVDGAWRDDKTGKVHREPMAPYHVALAEPAHLPILISRAAAIWRDEVAWFAADIGEATIHPAYVEADVLALAEDRQLLHDLGVWPGYGAVEEVQP